MSRLRNALRRWLQLDPADLQRRLNAEYARGFAAGREVGRSVGYQECEHAQQGRLTDFVLEHHPLTEGDIEKIQAWRKWTTS